MTQKKTTSSFFKRFFKPRDVFIRQQDKISFCSLSASRQWGIFLSLSAVVLWGVFTTVFFFRYDTVFSKKNAELEQIQNDYSTLQGEMSAFADYLDRIVSQIDDHERTISLLKTDSDLSETDAQNVLKQDSRPLMEISSADDDVVQLVKESERLKDVTVFARERLMNLMTKKRKTKQNKISVHQVLLQRDVAVAEAQALQKRVKNLEKQITGMQETQILVFRKMASLAGGNIDLIEDDLSGISQSLASAGFGMETLLNRIRRDKETIGIGGPFIPAPMSKPQHNLNISLVSLNQQLDRWYDLTALQDALPIGKPIKRIRVTSPFGSRGDPFQGAPAHHEAVDLGGMMGEPIYTTAPGKVIRAGRWGWYGNMVEIDHGLGFRTRYAHMDKIFVTKGDTVRSGDKIGTVGNSGRSTGPHLHYEIRVRGHAVDPMKFIKAKKNVFKS